MDIKVLGGEHCCDSGAILTKTSAYQNEGKYYFLQYLKITCLPDVPSDIQIFESKVINNLNGGPQSGFPVNKETDCIIIIIVVVIFLGNHIVAS